MITNLKLCYDSGQLKELFSTVELFKKLFVLCRLRAEILERKLAFVTYHTISFKSVALGLLFLPDL